MTTTFTFTFTDGTTTVITVAARNAACCGSPTCPDSRLCRAVRIQQRDFPAKKVKSITGGAS